MESILDYKGDRGLRLLDIFERLNRGELLNKRELTQYYGVGEKTIPVGLFFALHRSDK